MRKLQCQSCNSSLEWNGEDEIVTCQYCGMRYQMRSLSPQERLFASALKGGCVTDRPVLEGSEKGCVYYKTWLPEGWLYTIKVPSSLDRYCSISTAICPFIEMFPPDHSARIIHGTSNAYLDQAPPDPTGMGILPGKQTNDPSYLDPLTYFRFRPLTTAADYCDEMVILDGWCSNVSLVSQHDEMDETAKARIEQLKTILPDEVMNNAWWQWCRKLYRGMHAGREYMIVAETQIATSGYNIEEQRFRDEWQQQRAAKQQQRNQADSGFFSNLFGTVADGFSQMMIPQSQLPRWWQTDYEMMLMCPTEDFEKLYDEFLKVNKTAELGKDFNEVQQKVMTAMQQGAMQAQNATNNAMMNMAAERAASMERRAAIIQDKNDYTTGVMRDMISSNAASHDRSMNMTSEMIGGYNVYQGTDGNLVRADIGFDNVYQGTGNMSDWLVGTEGTWLEPGVDFVPLGKIDGGNY